MSNKKYDNDHNRYNKIMLIEKLVIGTAAVGASYAVLKGSVDLIKEPVHKLVNDFSNAVEGTYHDIYKSESTDEYNIEIDDVFVK